VDDGEFDAIVLAEAGLTRLGLAGRIAQVLSKELMLPAVGQGALGIEIRAGDARAQQAVAPLDDGETRAAVIAERALLAALRGGCLAPIGAWARLAGSELRLDAVVLSGDGRIKLQADAVAPPAGAEALGIRVAQSLRQQGSDDLIAASRGGSPPASNS
jgi:hydroxymethylbilane synthase